MTAVPTSLNVDELMARIRAEVARRKQFAQSKDVGSGACEPTHSAATVSLSPLPLPQLPKPQFAHAERYHLNDFLALHDEDFVSAAYRGVLRRSADVQGRQHFLTALRNGSLSKIEILGRLRYSPEGRRQHVPVQGLLPAFGVQHAYRLPVVGSLVAFAMALVRLPRIARNLQSLEGYQHQRNSELEVAIRNLALAAEGNDRQLDTEIARGEGGASELVRQTGKALADLRKRVDAGDASIEAALGNRQEQLAELAASMESAGRRIVSLEQAKEQSTQRADDAQQRIERLHGLVAESESRCNDLHSRIAAFESRRDELGSRLDTFDSRHREQESRIALLESHKQNVDKQLVDVIAMSQQTSAQLATTLRDALVSLEQRVDSLGAAIRFEEGDSRSSRLRLTERIARIEGRVHEHGLRLTQTPSIVKTRSVKGVPSATQTLSRFDELYFAFEERFRGSREDIRQRLSYYLPLLHESSGDKEGATILDIGCGRGEWLELLRDEKFTARGIDVNEMMAKNCIERGLDVEVGDAIALLKQLPDNTLGALTGFHIIEHLPLDVLIDLIEQAHRVVRPGGLIIFETPNPENVVVGACNFYLDPTHQRPLPPVLTQFLVESGGFTDVSIHRVNAGLLPQIFDEPAETDAPALRSALSYLRSIFLCAPDYSVVGHVA
jgi:SAM-dependent methyltransferase